MDILILGGTGQIGAPVAKALIAQDYRVFVTGRENPTDPALAEHFIRFVPGETDWSALPRCQVLVNCIGIIAEKRKHDFERIHYELVLELLQRQQELGFEYLVQISALGADVKHPARFLSSKGRAEHVIREQLTRYAIIRPSIVCTPGTALIRNLAGLIKTFGKWLGVIPLIGNGQTRVQPILIQDLAGAIVKIVERQPTAFTLDAVGPTSYSIRELLKLMESTLGINAKHVPVPSSLLVPVAYTLENINPVFFSREHLMMLATDNISNPAPIVALLERPLQTAEIFLTDPHNYHRGPG